MGDDLLMVWLLVEKSAYSLGDQESVLTAE